MPDTRHIKGEDAFGKFRILAGECVFCGEPQLCIQYSKEDFTLTDPPVDATILRSVDKYLGIQCGDYAKLHRQVAHIKDRPKKKVEVEFVEVSERGDAIA